MGKFSRDLSDSLVTKVKAVATEMGLKSMGINVEPIRLKKSKKDIGVILKGNDLVELYTGDDSIVCCALYEPAFDLVTDEVQDRWIQALLSQISYDMEKDKVVVTKPELSVSLGMWQKYGKVAVEDQELALITLKQIADMEKGKKNK